MTQDTASRLAAELGRDGVKLGDIKRRGREIKLDHELGLALWARGGFQGRLLATLIFDKRRLDQPQLEALASDMRAHPEAEMNQLADWLLANQLMKSKATVDRLLAWQDHACPLLRRLFWYHQARLRWTGQTPPANSGELLTAIDRTIASEAPEVQWAMNFCAGWIGVFEPGYRARCVQLGETTGLYRDEPVARNCTPSYLPEFIRIEAAKRD